VVHQAAPARALPAAAPAERPAGQDLRPRPTPPKSARARPVASTRPTPTLRAIVPATPARPALAIATAHRAQRPTAARAAVRRRVKHLSPPGRATRGSVAHAGPFACLVCFIFPDPPPPKPSCGWRLTSHDPPRVGTHYGFARSTEGRHPRRDSLMSNRRTVGRFRND
jgi:hypothetical protein